MEQRKKAGYALIVVIIAVSIFTVFLMMARSMWETEIQRDLEEELIFRGRQYVRAIDLYMKKHVNVYPPNLEILYEEKFLRKNYREPMSVSGKWNLVMQPAFGATAGQALLIVSEDIFLQYTQRAVIVGVCSVSEEEGFREYRKKKKYCEWAFYLGEDPAKDMPQLIFAGEDKEAEAKMFAGQEKPGGPEEPEPRGADEDDPVVDDN